MRKIIKEDSLVSEKTRAQIEKEVYGIVTEDSSSAKDKIDKLEEFEKSLKDEITTIIKREKENIKSEYDYCSYCKQYYRKNTFEDKVQKKVVEKQVYTDAGYGDDDMFGWYEITSNVRICPVGHACVGKILIEKPISEHYRRGEKPSNLVEILERRAEVIVE